VDISLRFALRGIRQMGAGSMQAQRARSTQFLARS